MRWVVSRWLFGFGRLVEKELVGTLFEVDLSLEGFGFGVGRGEDRIFILHHKLIGEMIIS